MIYQRPEASNNDDWLTLFDTLGNITELQFDSWRYREDAQIDFLLSGYKAQPTRLGLLRLASFWCAAGFAPSIDLSFLPRVEACSTTREKLAVMLLTMSQKNLSRAAGQTIAAHIADVVVDEHEPAAKQLLFSCISHYSTAIPLLIIPLQMFIAVCAKDELARLGNVIALHSEMLQAQKSHFDPANLVKLGLPA